MKKKSGVPVILEDLLPQREMKRCLACNKWVGGKHECDNRNGLNNYCIACLIFYEDYVVHECKSDN